MPTTIKKGENYDIIDGDCAGLSGECMEVHESSFGHTWAVIRTPNGLITKRAGTIRLSEEQPPVETAPEVTQDGPVEVRVHSPWNPDEQHPDYKDYVATNLLDALTLVPNTGDWYNDLKSWCERHSTGRLKANRNS
jgi:hypothetical protein